MPNKFDKSVFINYELDKEQKAQLRLWRKEAEGVLSAICEVVEAGNTITVKSDDYSGGYAAWIKPTSPEDDNYGCILSGRGASAENALAEVLFICGIIGSNPWPRPADKKSIRFWDNEK